MKGVIMLKITINEFMQIVTSIFDAVSSFEACENKEVNNSISEITIYDLDFKGERKIDIGIVGK